MADPTLYLYTSLTAGSSHIITATSRMETILKANRVPFRAIDCATDEKARQLWSRRSKGKKLPGLVKYGQIIGDLEQVEEWNEFGELVDQIEDVSDIFADTPMTDTPMPPPVNTIPPSLLKPIVEKSAGTSQPMSRSSSETRHISISEPSEKKVKVETPSINKEQNTLAMAMRDLGAEAAAKAGQMKKAAAKSALASSATKATMTAAPTSEPSAAPSTVPTPKKVDPSETTPNPAQIRSGSDAALESTSEEDKQSITAAKTPAQLTAEGVRRQSVEKVSPLAETAAAADTSDVPPIDAADEKPKSTEEQVLDLRRTSSIAKAKSGLSKETNVDDVSSEDEEDDESAQKKAASQAVANVEQQKVQQGEEKPTTGEAHNVDSIAEEESDEDEADAVVPKKVVATGKADKTVEEEAPSTKVSSSLVPESTTESTDDVSVTAPKSGQEPPKMHRGSSLSEAPEDEIKEVEKRNAIPEEEDEDATDSKDDREEEDEDDDEDDDEGEEEVRQKASASPTTTTKAIATGEDKNTEKEKETKPKASTVTNTSIGSDSHEVDPQDTEAAEPEDAKKSVGD